jgi:hypothetical protein
MRKLINRTTATKAIQAAALTLLVAATAQASTIPSFSEIASNITGAVSSFVTAIETIAMVAGLILLITGLMAFKQASQDMQGTGHHNKKAIVHVILGACLLMAPTVLAVIEQTLFEGYNTALS